MFKHAKMLGDCLVVAIDDDVRVKEYKGHDRPFNSQSDREYILRSLKFVDDVIVFGSDQKLIEIIQYLEPDIMMVGSDWRNKKIIGSEHAKEVIFFERINEYSTTKIIQHFASRR